MRWRKGKQEGGLGSVKGGGGDGQMLIAAPPHRARVRVTVTPPSPSPSPHPKSHRSLGLVNSTSNGHLESSLLSPILQTPEDLRALAGVGQAATPCCCSRGPCVSKGGTGARAERRALQGFGQPGRQYRGSGLDVEAVGGSDPCHGEAAPGAWCGLVPGRWLLLPRLERQGQRVVGPVGCKRCQR